MRLPGITRRRRLDRSGPRAALGRCSPPRSAQRGARHLEPRQPPPLPPARAGPRALAGIAALGSEDAAPTSCPSAPQLRGPWTRPAWWGAAPLPCGGSGRLVGPAERGAFFSGKLLSGSAGLSRGGQEKRSAPGGCDHPGTSPRCEPSPSARVLPLRPPPHADGRRGSRWPFALRPRRALPSEASGTRGWAGLSPGRRPRGLDPRAPRNRTLKGYTTQDAVPRDCPGLRVGFSPLTTGKAFSRHLHSAPESRAPALRNLEVSIHFKSWLLKWSGPTEAPRATRVPNPRPLGTHCSSQGKVPIGWDSWNL